MKAKSAECRLSKEHSLGEGVGRGACLIPEQEARARQTSLFPAHAGGGRRGK